MTAAADARVQAALLTMQRNREELMAAYAPQHPGRDQFPRSATFRWVKSHVTGRAVASTLMSAAVLRPAWLRMLGFLLARRRTR